MGLTFCRPDYAAEGEREEYHQHLPRMMMDFEVDSCYLCSVPFDMLVRRHHCRRCRNIFCRDCSSQRDRLLLYGLCEPVRLCNGCADVTPAENYFVECHVPLLVGGATLIKRQEGLLKARRRRQPVYVRVSADLSSLEETEEEEEDERWGNDHGTLSSSRRALRRRGKRWGVTRHYPLRDVESVDSVRRTPSGGGWGAQGGELEEGAPVALVIRMRGKGQLRLEASNPLERDRWVSALGEAFRRAGAPPLATEVEEERWQRKEEAAAEAQRLQNIQRRREHEATRAEIAAKYGLDPGRYSSRHTSGVGSSSGSGSASGSAVGDWGSRHYGDGRGTSTGVLDRRGGSGGGGGGGYQRSATGWL